MVVAAQETGFPVRPATENPIQGAVSIHFTKAAVLSGLMVVAAQETGFPVRPATENPILGAVSIHFIPPSKLTALTPRRPRWGTADAKVNVPV